MVITKRNDITFDITMELEGFIAPKANVHASAIFSLLYSFFYIYITMSFVSWIKTVYIDKILRKSVILF